MSPTQGLYKPAFPVILAIDDIFGINLDQNPCLHHIYPITHLAKRRKAHPRHGSIPVVARLAQALSETGRARAGVGVGGARVRLPIQAPH